jgi:cystathionine beta-synthase
MTPPHLRPYDSVLETIGWTPLIRLGRIGAGLRTPIYGKAEYANPGGSVKDRIGHAIIEDAERRGQLKPGGTIVEGTSGNTGVGLAIAAALKGYRCIFTMPDKMSMEKVRLLKAYGAEVVVTPTAVPPDHPEHYVMKAKQIVKDTPNAILANQFYNQVNPEAHYATMGPEIWRQTEGRVTHFVAGAGTGGTVSGAGKYLKEQNPRVRVIAGDPVGSLYTGYHRTRIMGEGHPYKVEGIGGDKIPTTVWFDWIDEFRQVSDKASFTMARRLAREEGMLLGGSAGLNVAIAVDLARALAQPALLERPVSEVMDPPFPEVEAGTAVDRVGAMLTRESPAALVRREGKLVGIVSRYDVLQQLIATR